jgi:uncharacterized protein (AIM24 family)
MKSHEIDLRIIGESIQLVEVELDPGETVIAEAGAMVYMEDGIRFEARMGDGAAPNQVFFDKLVSAGSRVLADESLFITHFTNRELGKKRVAFSSPYPGTVIPLDLLQMGGQVIVQKFEGDGKEFIHAGGTVIERTLHNEVLRIDTGCVVAFEPQIDFDVETVSSLKSMVFGGEGLSLATLRGTGKVWLRSMPIRKLIQALAPYGRNSGKESSSILGNFLQR